MRVDFYQLTRDSVEIAVCIYKLSDQGKLKNDWSARDQLRRAACSISSNIAEGFEYQNNLEFKRFLKYAKGSSGELRSQLLILWRTGYLTEAQYDTLHEQLLTCSRQISALIKYLSQPPKQPHSP